MNDDWLISPRLLCFATLPALFLIGLAAADMVVRGFVDCFDMILRHKCQGLALFVLELATGVS